MNSPTSDGIEAAYNYRRLDDRLATAGQPTLAQLESAAQAGIQVVINLRPVGADGAPPDEAERVRALGMAYAQIPVIWEHPRLQDFLAFSAEMERRYGSSILVHCAANMRVSAFIYLYRVLRLGWRSAEALPDLRAIWTPDGVWEGFIAGVLNAAAGPRWAHLADRPAPEIAAHLRSRLDPAVRLSLGPEPPEHAAFGVLVDSRPSTVLVTASSALRSLVIPMAGLPRHVPALLAGRPEIAVYNLHFNDAATAEVALALLLAAAKRVAPMDRSLRQGVWTPPDAPGRVQLLAGKTALVLGYGAIGRRVARALAALEVRVIATRGTPGPVAVDGVAEVHPAADTSVLLPQAEILMICLPLTPDTEGLLGEAELSRLPEGALLVNVGRGPVVDEAALFEALRSGRLGAAGIDVWYRYPDDYPASSAVTAPSAFPFESLDNVVMSPHRAGNWIAQENERSRMEALAVTLNALASGSDAPNRVDLARGY